MDQFAKFHRNRWKDSFKISKVATCESGLLTTDEDMVRQSHEIVDERSCSMSLMGHRIPSNSNLKFSCAFAEL